MTRALDSVNAATPNGPHALESGAEDPGAIELAVLPLGLLEDLVAARAHVIELEKRLSEQRDEFLLVIHDLAQPIGVVTNTIEALDRRYPTALLSDLRDVTSAAHEIERYIDTLRAVAKADHSGLRAARVLQPLRPLLDEVLAGFTHAASSRQVCLSLVAAASVELEIDAGLFRRVLQNLLANALRYAPHGGTIEIVVDTLDAEVSIAVRNDGPPIPDAIKPYLFEKFSPRAEPDNPWRGGLGLYFCRRAVEAHGGRIDCVSLPDWPVSIEIRLPRVGAMNEPESGHRAPATYSGLRLRQELPAAPGTKPKDSRGK